MNRLNDDALNIALEALIDIENDKLPSTKGLFALQQVVWGWLEPDREKSSVASNLFIQATKINKLVKKKNESLVVDVEIQRGIDTGLSKSQAVSELAKNKASGEERGIWLKASPNHKNAENEAKRVAKLRRIHASLNHIKQPLKSKDNN